MQDIRISSPVSLPDAFQPQARSPQFNPRDVRISAPSPIDLDAIRITEPVPGLNQPQALGIVAAVSGTPTVVTGSTTVGSFDGVRTLDSTGQFTLRDTIEVTATEVVINWAPDDTGIGGGSINFLGAGNALRFTSDGFNYTVLNRVLPADSTRAIRFDGAVQSYIDSAGTVTGGNIWFYSPGGIIVGGTGRFDVGSLLLTTTDIDISGGFPGAFGGTISITGAVGGGSVVIESPVAVGQDAGPQIELSAANSYFAVVAPRLVQGGNVSVNGAVAYVAADQAVMTINNNNLFDIQIPVGAGTNDANGIVHSGTTTGPTPLNFSDRQRIYMVATPKNQAMTMLLGGTIGYTPATAAFASEGAIILSAGGNIDVPFSSSNSIDKTVDPAKDANIDMSGANFTNSVEAFANNNISIFATTGSDFIGKQDANAAIFDFTAGDSINIGANGGGNVDIVGDVTFNAANAINIAVGPGSQFNQIGDLVLNAFTATQGGVVDIDITGPGLLTTGSGQMLIDGTFNILAGVDGIESRRAIVDDGTNTFGGTINVDILSGGLLDISGGPRFGQSTFSASASPNLGLVTGADAVGGTINFNIIGAGSTLVADGFRGLELFAKGDATSTFRGTSTGGSGTGGAVNLTVNGGTITANRLELDASADGSSNASGNVSESLNSAVSGDVIATFANATLAIGELALLTGASAARSYDATGNLISGNATGGDMNLTFDNTGFNGDNLVINGSAFGASGTVLNGEVAPGDQGSSNFNILNGSVLTMTSDFRMFGSGSAGAGGSSSSVDLNLLIDNAAFNAANVFLDNSRRTNAPAGSSDGTPGNINLTIQNGGALSTGILSLNSSAESGAAGGRATAGDINLLVDAGALTLTETTGTSLLINASGLGANNDGSGATGDPGLGVGGDVNVTLQGGGTMIMGSANISGNGLIAEPVDGRGFAASGEGGSGIGGSVTFNLNGSTFVATDLTISSNGTAANGGDSTIIDPFSGTFLPNTVGNGGTGTGGVVTFNLNGTDVTVNNLTVSADGAGGSGGDSRETEGTPAGDGGQGIGGTAIFNANSGSLTVSNSLTVSSGGFGGQGGTGEGVDAGNGGDSTGGAATFNLDGTAVVDIGAGGLTVSSDTTGGAGGFALVGNSPSPAPTPAQNAGDGGNAVAGTATFNNLSGTITFSDLTVSATGTGGTAGQGGTLTFNDVTGMDDFTESFVGQIGGNGGNGTGGTAIINLGQDDPNPIQYTVDASGSGASGSDGVNGGNGGDGFGGTAAINVIDATVVLDDPTINATATGGAGGVGSGTGGNGGAGGNAAGGTAILDVTGALGVLSTTGALTIISEAVGGTGGAGGDNPIDSGPTGMGGDGGNGAGGIIQVSATGGATLNYTTDGITNARGIAGAGGVGGDSPSFVFPGAGGSGGDASGGSISFSATGGSTFNASGNGSDSQLLADALGGAGGVGGTGIAATVGNSGNGGGAAGGAVNLTVDGAGSSMSFAENLIIDVGGVASRDNAV
ncbi:beta strand repeat-containing protein, partial [Parasphingorhabdus sp.]|uniref:beta strand repeat-containing protein n=1 Tax=Parasphingorhabdus sp. TaxID=2709688 RepID=UPI003C771362